MTVNQGQKPPFLDFVGRRVVGAAVVMGAAEVGEVLVGFMDGEKVSPVAVGPRVVGDWVTTLATGLPTISAVIEEEEIPSWNPSTISLDIVWDTIAACVAA